jgi:hypothetical protein
MTLPGDINHDGRIVWQLCVAPADRRHRRPVQECHD